MRSKYGDDQIAAAIRNGRREFLENPDAELVNSGGNRHRAVIGMTIIPINSKDLNDYTKQLREGSPGWDEGQKRAWGWENTLAFIRSRNESELSGEKKG